MQSASERLCSMIGESMFNDVISSIHDAEVVEDFDVPDHLDSFILPEQSDEDSWDQLCYLIDSYQEAASRTGKSVYFVLEPVN